MAFRNWRRKRRGRGPTQLYLRIEETARELASRLLIANYALEQGFEAILAAQRAVWENLQDLQPGIVLFKGNNGAQSLRMRRSKAAGHLVSSLEEEVLRLPTAAR